ncbi:MAG: hypothetical protein U1C50_02525 [Patescibacteria group bacterium]|nr:hypothetical protein [Patescibacteria group bacterium]
MFQLLTVNPRRRQFFHLLVFYAAYLWFRNFSTSVLGPHFLEQAVSIKQMILGNVWFFLAGVLTLLLLKQLFSRLAWRLAIILSFISILLIMKIDHLWQFYLSYILAGMNMVLFSTPYNIVHFQLTPKTRTSYSSAIMFSVYPLISLISPLLAGWLAEINYIYIWIGTGAFFLLALFLTKFQVNFTISFNWRRSFEYLRPTRVYILLQGLWEAVIFSAIPVFTLYFIQTPLYYGTYLAYLGLVAVVANLFLGQLSDKLRHRLKFLYPVTFLSALITLLLPLAINDLKLWLILTGVLQFLLPLFWNFSTAFFVDLQPDLIRDMPVREILLAAGRTAGSFLVFANFYFETRPTYVFYLLGGIMCLYPLLLYRRRRQYQTVLS